MRTTFRSAVAGVVAALAMTGAAAGTGSRGPDAANATPRARPIVVIDAPSNLGLRPPRPGVEPGVRHLPRALRAQGLVDRLRARDGGVVAAPPYSPDADADVGFRNGTALAAYSAALARRLGTLLDADDRPFVVVLGGDCSVLLGATLALRPRGRYGLAFIDGHDDYSYVRDRAKYAGLLTAAGLDLALATGHGPAALVDIDGAKPYVREADVVHLGLVREPADTPSYATETFDDSAITRFDRATIARDGAAVVGARARARLERPDLEGYWIHLDVDVLHQDVMPAVDSPNPDGLSYAELEALLTELLRSDRVRGLELTIFDPDLDPDGRHARALADRVVAAFAASGRVAHGSP